MSDETRHPLTRQDDIRWKIALSDYARDLLGPLNRLTSQALIDRYAFLDEARLVRKTTFSNGVTAVVNGSPADYAVTSASGAEAVLPPYGFLIEAGTFTAFVARAWAGKVYDAPVLFTVRSLDDRALEDAARFRIFHGFGESALVWRGTTYDVVRERVVD
jgi:hypothetical protein